MRSFWEKITKTIPDKLLIKAMHEQNEAMAFEALLLGADPNGRIHDMTASTTYLYYSLRRPQINLNLIATLLAFGSDKDNITRHNLKLDTIVKIDLPKDIPIPTPVNIDDILIEGYAIKFLKAKEKTKAIQRMLTKAVENNDTKRAALALQFGADVNFTLKLNDAAQSYLYTVCSRRYININLMKLLLRNGADISAQRLNIRTGRSLPIIFPASHTEAANLAIKILSSDTPVDIDDYPENFDDFFHATYSRKGELISLCVDPPSQESFSEDTAMESRTPTPPPTGSIQYG